jgi:hypothetical protein
VTTQPGPLADEAARLVEALSDWARDHSGDLGGQLGQHIGGGTECTLCPLCQLLAVVRRARPETVAHLVDASVALTAALRSLAEGHAGRGATHNGVERIDLDDDAGPDR